MRTALILPAFWTLLLCTIVAPGAKGAVGQAITVAILQPTEGRIVGAELVVQVRVQSTYEVTRVVASVDGRSTDLAFDLRENALVGRLSLLGLAEGPKMLVVTATDILGASQQATRSIVYDTPPKLLVSLPLDFRVARPQIRLLASCTDASGPCTVAAEYDGYLFGRATTELDALVDLSRWDGREIAIRFTATDQSGQRSSRSARVFVENSVKLRNELELPWRIVDVDSARVLLYDEAGGLEIYDRVTRLRIPVRGPLGVQYESARLTPLGVIFKGGTSESATATHVYEWRNGELLRVSGGPTPTSTSWLSVTGRYAIWGEGGALFRRDLLAGETIRVNPSVLCQVVDDGCVS